jgi:hypothetical protein
LDEGVLVNGAQHRLLFGAVPVGDGAEGVGEIFEFG